MRAVAAVGPRHRPPVVSVGRGALELLQGLPLFASLTPPALRAVAERTVTRRVAATVCERAESAGALDHGAAFTLGGAQEQLARTLATTREGVARALAELRRQGVIQQAGARLRVLDAERLAARARGGESG